MSGVDAMDPLSSVSRPLSLSLSNLQPYLPTSSIHPKYMIDPCSPSSPAQQLTSPCHPSTVVKYPVPQMMPSNQKSQRPRHVELVQRFSPSCASQEASAAGTGSLFGAQLGFSTPHPCHLCSCPIFAFLDCGSGYIFRYLNGASPRTA